MKTTNKRRSVSLFLALMMLASVSCGNTSDGGKVTTSGETTDTTTAETVDTRYVPDAEAKNFGGKELRLASYICESVHYSVLPEEETGDTISDALFIRNRNIMDKYGVTMSEYTFSWDETSKIRSGILAGDDSYDLISVDCPSALEWYKDGLVIAYDDLPYIDLGKGYWDQSINDSLSLDGVHYVGEGAYNLDLYDLTFCLLVNKPLCEKYGIKDIYSDVSSGKWTFDLMNKYMMLVTDDLDGNTVMDEKDQYGYTAHPKMVAPGFWIGADELSIVKDSNDHPTINMTDTHFVEVFDRIFNLVHDSGASYLTAGDGLDIPSECRKIFSEDRSLFIDMSFYFIEAMRSVDSDFGIIPYPKYDEAQEEYHSRVCYYFPSVVPITCKDSDFIGYMLEVMNYESYTTTIPAYYETALKTKSTRDNESEAMLDLIFASRRIDIGDSTLCNLIRDNFIYTMMKEDQRNLVSEVAKNEAKINERLAK